MIKIAKRIDIEKHGDKKIGIALLTSFVVLTIQYFILIFFNLMDTANGSKVQFLSKAIVGVIYLYALPVVINRNIYKLVGIYCIAIFVFLLNFIFFPENHPYIKEVIFPFFFMCLPAFVYSMSLDDLNILKKIMKKSSLIVFIFGTILFVLTLSGKVSIGVYSMELSYYMLLPAIMFIDELLENFSPKTMLASLISIMVILSLGSRGALICIVLFIVLKLIRFGFNMTYKKFFYSLLIIGTIMTSLIYFENILKYIDNVLMSFGIRSRSIQIFLSGDVHLSGRDNIYQNIIREIYSNPILGIGLAGDRRFTDTGYAHNFFLEVLSNFGVVFGSIILIILIFIIMRKLLTVNDGKYNMILVWLSLGFVPLLVSSSYLINIKFWIFMGLIISGLFKKRKSKCYRN